MLRLVVTCNSFEIFFQAMFGLLCVKSSSLLVIGVVFFLNIIILKTRKKYLRTLAIKRITNLCGIVIEYPHVSWVEDAQG